jgi:hypothetical protein
MKAPFSNISFSSALAIVFYLLLCTACHQNEVQQFTVELTQGDGTRESYNMAAGGLLLVYDGEMHHVVNMDSVVANDELGLDVTSYSVAHDTIKGEYTVQRTGATRQKISLTKSALLDPGGTVQVNLQSVSTVKATQNPKGKCRGNCCEAKCFSLWCCVDPDECKDVPCDCKPPSGCLVTHTVISASQFFELHHSGKDMMVVKM